MVRTITRTNTQLYPLLQRTSLPLMKGQGEEWGEEDAITRKDSIKLGAVAAGEVGIAAELTTRKCSTRSSERASVGTTAKKLILTTGLHQPCGSRHRNSRGDASTAQTARMSSSCSSPWSSPTKTTIDAPSRL